MPTYRPLVRLRHASCSARGTRHRRAATTLRGRGSGSHGVARAGCRSGSVVNATLNDASSRPCGPQSEFRQLAPTAVATRISASRTTAARVVGCVGRLGPACVSSRPSCAATATRSRARGRSSTSSRRCSACPHLPPVGTAAPLRVRLARGRRRPARPRARRSAHRAAARLRSDARRATASRARASTRATRCWRSSASTFGGHEYQHEAVRRTLARRRAPRPRHWTGRLVASRRSRCYDVLSTAATSAIVGTCSRRPI